MDKKNIESLISIFKELTTELPQELIYRANGDCIELKSLENYVDGHALEPAEMGWNHISSQVYGIA